MYANINRKGCNFAVLVVNSHVLWDPEIIVLGVGGLKQGYELKASISWLRGGRGYKWLVHNNSCWSSIVLFVCLLVLIRYIPVNNFFSHVGIGLPGLKQY